MTCWCYDRLDESGHWDPCVLCELWDEWLPPKNGWVDENTRMATYRGVTSRGVDDELEVY